jgi:hypothetical protein
MIGQLSGGVYFDFNIEQEGKGQVNVGRHTFHF